MALVIVGLGNPGKEYEKTRHNAGRSAVELVAKNNGFDEFVFNKTSNALLAKGAIEGENAILVLPETMMNLSGKAVANYVKSVKAA
jgi:PTH1 family peptidyl-tRNA hydrolase